MIEAPQSLPSDWKRKAVVTIAFAAAAFLCLAFAYERNRCNELGSALEASQVQNSALAAREKEVASELSKARSEASAGKQQVAKLQDEIVALTGKLRATEHQTMANKTATKPTTKNSEAGASKNEALLAHFIRLTDDFTQPKVYWHGHLASLGRDALGSPGVVRFIDLKVDTDGKISMNDFKAIKVLHGDEVLNFPDIALFNQFLRSQDLGNTLLKCRLVWAEQDFNSKLPGVPIIDKTIDLLLNKADLTAIKETFELAESFKQAKSQK